jgi:hypothetical protein
MQLWKLQVYQCALGKSNNYKNNQEKTYLLTAQNRYFNLFALAALKVTKSKFIMQK